MRYGVELGRLAELYADSGPFASAYVEVSRDLEDGDRIAELVARDAADAINAAGAPEEVAAAVRERLAESTHQPAPISRCVVASERGVLLDRLSRHHRAQPVAGWGPLPDLTDWLADVQQARAFVLALVDHEGGDVTSYSADGMGVDREASVGESSPRVHKVAGGGWAHLRMQHTSENVWFANAVEVAGEIERQVAAGPDLVVLAGDPKSRAIVLEKLPDTLSAEVVELDHGGRAVDGGDDALAAAVEEAVRGKVVAATLAAVHELRDRMGRGSAVAVGVRDVADAFVRGQVDTLLLDPDAAAEVDLQPRDHPGLALGAVPLEAPVPADLGLVAAACLTDADLVISRASTLGGSPAAALLRWDQIARDTRG
jgi:hypothetical protein